MLGFLIQALKINQHPLTPVNPFKFSHPWSRLSCRRSGHLLIWCLWKWKLRLVCLGSGLKGIRKSSISQEVHLASSGRDRPCWAPLYSTLDWYYNATSWNLFSSIMPKTSAPRECYSLRSQYEPTNLCLLLLDVCVPLPKSHCWNWILCHLLPITDADR